MPETHYAPLQIKIKGGKYSLDELLALIIQEAGSEPIKLAMVEASLCAALGKLPEVERPTLMVMR